MIYGKEKRLAYGVHEIREKTYDEVLKEVLWECL